MNYNIIVWYSTPSSIKGDNCISLTTHFDGPLFKQRINSHKVGIFAIYQILGDCFILSWTPSQYIFKIGIIYNTEQNYRKVIVIFNNNGLNGATHLLLILSGFRYFWTTCLVIIRWWVLATPCTRTFFLYITLERILKFQRFPLIKSPSLALVLVSSKQHAH